MPVRMKLLRIPLLLVACAGLAGCVGVIPMRQRSVGPEGKIPNVDLTFLEAGKTTRAEVAEKLGGINVGVESQHFFVGRWRSSKMGAWLVVGGYGGGAAAAGRIWRNANLLVSFDSADRVEAYEVFPDKLLQSRLERVSRETVLNPKEQEEIVIVNGGLPLIETTLVLTPQSLAATYSIPQKHGRKEIHYEVPTSELAAVRVERYQDESGAVRTDLLFAKDLRTFQGPRGKHLHVQVTVPQLAKLLAFHRQTGAGKSGPPTGDPAPRSGVTSRSADKVDDEKENKQTEQDVKGSDSDVESDKAD